MHGKLEATQDLAEVVLAASRVLVGVADRSLPEAADVTLHQFRALALLASHGEMNVNSLAELLDVSPSTVTRLCDRLVRKKLVRRRQPKESRREVCIGVSASGARLVADVLDRRRAAIEDLLARVPPAAHRPLAEGLKAFVEASGSESEAPRTLV